MEEPKKDSTPGMKIAGINLAILVGYTLLFKLSDGGAMLDEIALFIHVFVCVILAIAQKNWIWLLSGIMVLIIGFSTCVYFLPLDIK